MDSLLTDVRQAFRGLMRAPGFTVAVAAVLSLGIAATTTIFSVVDGVLLKPLPFGDPSRIVAIDTIERGEADQSAYPDVRDWRAQSSTLDHIGAYATNAVTLTGAGGAQILPIAATAGELFQVLDVSPIRGRVLTADDDVKGAPAVVLIGEHLWNRVFNHDDSIVGRAVTLDGVPFTVVGVMPASFEFPYDTDRIQAWLPVHALAFTSRFVEQRGASFLSAIGHLRPGRTAAAADAELGTVMKRLADSYPRSNKSRSVRVRPLRQNLVENYRAGLIVLLGAVGALLLVACANVANLLLTRGTARRREIAIRSALGAGRGRLVRQLVAESVALSAVGGAAGVVLAAWGVSALVAASPIEIPRLHTVTIDRTALAFATFASIATGIMFGLFPAWHLSRSDAREALGDEGRGSTSATTGRMRQALVVAEMALSLVLLVCAGLLVRSLVHLQQVDPGFATEHAVGMQLMLRDSRYPDAASQIGFTRRLVDELRAAPGIRDAAVATTLPLSGSGIGIGFSAEGHDDPDRRAAATFWGVSAGYTRVMGIRLLRGRALTEADDERAANVILINETMARQYWPGQDPIGKHVTIQYGKTGAREIVGVVADVRAQTLAESARLQVYAPFAQAPVPIVAAVVKSEGSPESAAGSMRAALASVDSQLAAVEVRTLDDYLARTVATPRFTTALTAGFAALALLLAGVGLYAVMAYSVAQRRREIGIRMALGAEPSRVRADVLLEAMHLGAIGIAAGAAGSLAAARVLGSLLFGVKPTDPATFAGVSALLAAVLLLAAYIPARRATRVDPMLALRAE